MTKPKTKTRHFICYIKSHCEAPDFEWEGEAKSKREFVNNLLKGNGGLGQYGWEYPEVAKHTIELDENGNPKGGE